MKQQSSSLNEPLQLQQNSSLKNKVVKKRQPLIG
jgi:hypothetical protein